ncbi:hypothetical protein [Mycoplana sp. BE70]|uniref:hypothetical protein n=1 Tax=Mycoplana sp. BE70 TaxID=2817775 RepID=UPI00286C9701|nr:hypothetical protein [Mycoplana sp. BE70]
MPSPPATSKEEHAEREDVAFLVPFFGVVLLLPPLLNLFGDLRTAFGVPVEVLYLFGVWLLVIAAAVLLSRRRQFREATPATEADQASPPSLEPPGRQA